MIPVNPNAPTVAAPRGSTLPSPPPDDTDDAIVLSWLFDGDREHRLVAERLRREFREVAS